MHAEAWCSSGLRRRDVCRSSCQSWVSLSRKKPKNIFLRSGLPFFFWFSLSSSITVALPGAPGETGAHRDTGSLMYCWTPHFTGGLDQKGEMEMYAEGDRYKIREGRGKRGNDEEAGGGGGKGKWSGKENTELSGRGDRCSDGRCRGEDGRPEGPGGSAAPRRISMLG